MLSLPFFVFVFILIFARHELEWRGIVTALVAWGAAFGICMATDAPTYVFIAFEVAIDIVLILVIFGGDIRIR